VKLTSFAQASPSSSFHFDFGGSESTAPAAPLGPFSFSFTSQAAAAAPTFAFEQPSAAAQGAASSSSNASLQQQAETKSTAPPHSGARAQRPLFTARRAKQPVRILTVQDATRAYTHNRVHYCGCRRRNQSARSTTSTACCLVLGFLWSSSTGAVPASKLDRGS
jgi:hypothetical protein